MLKLIKKLMPKSIKTYLRPYKDKFYDNPRKRRLALKMQEKHQQLLKDLKRKEKIKVVFICFSDSIWKLESVFQKMLKDPYFEPLVLICPITVWGEEQVFERMESAYFFHKKLNHPVIRSFIKNENRWVELYEIGPDIIFFTDPGALTMKEYYEDAYLNYLSCYTPYYSDAVRNLHAKHIRNNIFDNVVWKSFLSDNSSACFQKNIQQNEGVNILVSGSPLLEELADPKFIDQSVWKEQEKTKKKIIYAPHQSIFKDKENGLNLSTFVELAVPIRKLVTKYSEHIQWAFKPHPALKSNLYKHPNWGKEKTDEYFKFWEVQENTQVDSGKYIDLFHSSDTIIHDSGSFIYEYLFTKKPCAFLELPSVKKHHSFTDTALEALSCYSKLHDENDIEKYLLKLINDELKISNAYQDFYRKNIDDLYKENSPSEFIVNAIKQEFI